jgi:hypothetical protein
MTRDYFNFHIVIFPFMCSNIPSAPAYGVQIFQLIQYSRACRSYQDFIERELLLSKGLAIVNQSSEWLSWGHYFERFPVAIMTWLIVTEYLWHKLPQICTVCRNHNLVFTSFVIYYRVYNESNTTGATCGAGAAYPSGVLKFTPVFSGVRVL